MKCTVSELKTAWRQAAGVCPARSPREILQYVRLDISDESFALHATDGELYVTIGMCETPQFSRLLPGKSFSKLLDACTAAEITFDGDAIKCGDDVWELSAPDVNDWPYNGIESSGKPYEVDCGSMRAAIGVSVLSVDEESTRYALGGVLLDFVDADTLALVATDGRRLSVYQVDCDCSGEPDRDVKAIVPAKAMKTLAAMCGDDGTMTFAFGVSGGITFTTRNAIIHSRLVEGRFPDWRQVVPATHAATFTLTAGTISDVLKSASITTSEESRGLHLTISANGLTCTSKAPDVGQSRVMRQLQFDAEAEATINPDYLLPVLHKLGNDCELSLAYIDSESPLLFSHDGGFRYVLMPLAG